MTPKSAATQKGQASPKRPVRKTAKAPAAKSKAASAVKKSLTALKAKVRITQITPETVANSTPAAPARPVAPPSPVPLPTKMKPVAPAPGPSLKPVPARKPASAPKPAALPVRPELVDGQPVRGSTSSPRAEIPPPPAALVPAPKPEKPVIQETPVPPASVETVTPSVRPAPAAEAPVAAEVPPAAAALKPLSISVPLVVKELAEKLSVSPSELIKHLLDMKMMVTINQLLTEEPVEKLLKIYGYQYQRMQTLEEKLEAEHDEQDPSRLIPRPPVVTFMGHVDHGKTSLLDAIRQTRVVEGEAGGITQHIGAYRVMLPKGTIAFLDTPGHEAFTAMRARGANVTDIVVLVVAADDGVMPQTKEAIDHAQAAEATLMVALNKMDKPTANPDKVKKQLMELGLMSEEWGGKTIVVPVSAKTGQGIDQLLDMMLLEAEVLELKADPTKPGRGVVLEGKLSRGGGPIAHVLVRNGTLRVGDVILSGTAWGRIRALIDARGHRLNEAGPSTPVEVMGLNGVPKAGESFAQVSDEKRAREIAQCRQEEQREANKTQVRRFVSLEEFRQQLESGRVKSLNLILKADVQGSLEALRESLMKLSTEQASLKFLHVGVGAISEPDILLAEASNAVVIGFNVQMSPEAEALAKQEQVDVRLYQIIYKAVDDIRAALEGLLEPRRVEQVLGRAKVLQVFKVSKVGTIAGSQVLKGKIQRGTLGRVFRGQEQLFQGKIDSLKRFKEDVREVAEGVQCGIGLSGFGDLQPDDIIESIEVQHVAQRL